MILCRHWMWSHMHHPFKASEWTHCVVPCCCPCRLLRSVPLQPSAVSLAAGGAAAEVAGAGSAAVAGVAGVEVAGVVASGAAEAAGAGDAAETDACSLSGCDKKQLRNPAGKAGMTFAELAVPLW
jgi:hypothetical protein